jgi:hypothetical protein
VAADKKLAKALSVSRGTEFFGKSLLRIDRQRDWGCSRRGSKIFAAGS